jgi:hypothetical protein
MSDLVYVYAVVPDGTTAGGAPRGLDERQVAVVPEGGVAALVSHVDASYGSGLDERIADVAWLGPRAAAHDAVLTWASDQGPVVPLPLLSLFKSDDAVRRMLRDRRAELTALIEHVARGREYGVRVFRIDDELLAALGNYSGAIAEVSREASNTTSPGQRYLLGRKLESMKKDELHRVSREVGSKALDRLSARALATAEDPLPTPTGDQVALAVLNASFLVAHDRVDDFRLAVTELVREYDGRGFRIEFTGPWPPYHFTREMRTTGATPPRVTS